MFVHLIKDGFGFFSCFATLALLPARDTSAEFTTAGIIHSACDNAHMRSLPFFLCTFSPFLPACLRAQMLIFHLFSRTGSTNIACLNKDRKSRLYATEMKSAASLHAALL